MSIDKLFNRIYYQVYAEWNYNPKVAALLLEAVTRKLELERLEYQTHQIRIMAEQNTEIKIGRDPFIQISSPDEDFLMKLWRDILIHVANRLEEEEAEK